MTHAAVAMPHAVLRAWAALLAALDERPPLEVAVALGDAATVLLDTEPRYAVPSPAAVRAEVQAVGGGWAPPATPRWHHLTTGALRHLTTAIEEASSVPELGRYGATAALVRRALEQSGTATAPGVDAP